jgi:hypothetical protein
MRGAGGTNGGIGSFFVGLVMGLAGLYLLLSRITVSHPFDFGYPLYRVPMGFASFYLTSGSMLIPFMIGVGLIFFNAKSIWGWVLAAGSLVATLFGVIMSLSISLQNMSLLDLLIILVLCVGGLGLFARSLREQ